MPPLRAVGKKVLMRALGELDPRSTTIELVQEEGSWEPWMQRLEVLSLGPDAQAVFGDELKVGDHVVIASYHGDSVWAELVDGEWRFNSQKRGVRLVFARTHEDVVGRIVDG